VCRLVREDSAETLGIRLQVVHRFGSCPSDYFTNDDGASFRRVALYSSAHGVDMNFEDTETDPETIATLRQALSTWKSASGHSEERAAIHKTCTGLRELLASVSQSNISPHLQVVGSIQAKAQSVPDESFYEVKDELDTLLTNLGSLDAEDGRKILSSDRIEKFLPSPLPQIE